ncbi:uncharacterized protein LOC106441844 [Brassica napus]|uniref:uncharacterized protein LOC106441844 n=1 Tax=Brassica napus TaxID=3708 RepID=UPI0006AB2AB4|nr:uncharacterized protein LOC106441844 [Brassica napus]
MSKISNLDYVALNLSGDNYLQWALDTKINFRSKELGDAIIEGNNETDKNRYRAISIIRHHLIEGLKDQYLIMENPLDLWTALQRREMRPIGTTSLPEANEAEKKDPKECNHVHDDKRSHGKGRSRYKGHGRDNYSYGRQGNHNNRGRGSSYGRGRGSYGSGQGGISKPSNSTKLACHRCGMSNHWAKNCGTPKHLCELYQESLKNKNPEAHMVHDTGYDADDDSDLEKDDLLDFETSDCLKD